MSDKMREEFEAAIALEANEPVLSVYLSRRNETYSTSTLHFAWWAWQASRSAVVIELPEWNGEPFNESVIFGHGIAKTQAISAIKSAGLKVAP